jgi:hypothetical protein
MSQQVRKNRNKKNLRIGVRFNGDEFVLLNGSPLPKLRTNAVGELVLQPDVIEDWADRERLTRDDVVRMLERGSRIFLGVSPHLVGDPSAEGLLREPEQMKLKTEYWIVEVRLEQDLRIRIRGDQEARLEKCKCLIPALKREASSVNHAFTLASEAYETERLSHTGNVFERAYTQVEPAGWRTLDEIRVSVISNHVAAVK